jgi:uncharacterized membrane protein YphA (DoxX/SURF4 family)
VAARAAGPSGCSSSASAPVLQRIDLLGLAAFVLVAGPGRWSADVERGAARETTLPDAAKAVWALRVAAGVALIVVAFVEKLANPDMALAFLADNPDFNVAALVAPADRRPRVFVRIAGAIEVLFGLLLIIGALPQACVLIAGVPVQRDAVVLRDDGARRPPARLRRDARPARLRSDPALRPAVRRCWPWGGGARPARRAGRPRGAR